MNMKSNIRLNKLDNGVTEVRVDKITGIAVKVDDKWELSPGIRNHRDEVVKVLENKS
jgi:hypothetical protein